ncbi:MAG: 3-oxoacyl-ACP reductase FabG [Ardenticatenaceae bacterium]|nr:3-oxoacyl-ACP reductase FabG [Ardenticatenaceae bacterium]HBY92892.1 hypothetical protein [Chloroflexota bacterium]
MRFQGRVALVTGSGRGIGKATALRLAREGAAVAINDVVEERLQQARTDFDAISAQLLTIKADVTDTQQVRQMVDQVVERFGRLDVLVNNVGASWGSTKIDVDEADWDRILDVNLKSVLRCVQVAVPHMVRQGGGKIVNIASSAGRYRSLFAGHPYVCAKAGILGFTRQLAFELASKGINVNCVVPGNIGTEEGEKDWANLPKDLTDFIMDSTPIRRLGKPEEIAAAIAFLASDDASYVTGVALDVNGGLWMA